MKKYSITKRIMLVFILAVLITALLVLFLAEHGVHASPILGSGTILEMHRYSILLIMAVVLISGALAYNIIRSTMKKIELLSVQIESTTVEKLSVPLDNPYMDPEVCELVDSFNIMTGKLNETIALQSRYAANIAHEYRTPLAIMQANIDLYRKKIRLYLKTVISFCS